MTAIRYNGPIFIVQTYLQGAVISSNCAKFNQDSSRTERLVCVKTDGQTDKRSDGQQTWINRLSW